MDVVVINHHQSVTIGRFYVLTAFAHASSANNLVHSCQGSANSPEGVDQITTGNYAPQSSPLLMSLFAIPAVDLEEPISQNGPKIG